MPSNISEIQRVSGDKKLREHEIIDTITGFSERKTSSEKRFEALSKLYCNEDTKYRHKYSEIAKYVHLKGESNDTEDYLPSICLSLCEEFKNDPLIIKDEIYHYIIKALNKLADHIELEMFREHIDTAHRKKIADIDANAQDTIKKLIDIEKNALDAVKELNDAKAKLDKAEMGYISTLGLFSGIIMAFTGVFAISGNVLANLELTPSYKLLLVVALLGLVLFNAVYAIFYCISRFLDRKFLDRCFTTKKENCENCPNQCKAFLKAVKHHYVFVFANMFFVFLLFASCIVWFITSKL